MRGPTSRYIALKSDTKPLRPGLEADVIKGTVLFKHRLLWPPVSSEKNIGEPFGKPEVRDVNAEALHGTLHDQRPNKHAEHSGLLFAQFC